MGKYDRHINIGMLGLATLVHIASFVSPGWEGTTASSYGLWYTCFNSTCEGLDLNNLGAIFKATQAMETIALIIYILAAAAGIYRLPRKSAKITFPMLGIMSFCAGTFSMVGVILFMCMENVSSPYYSLFLCIIAALFAFIAGGPMFNA